MEVDPAVLVQTLGAVLVAVVMFFGGRYASRLTKKATDSSTAVDAYDRLTGRLEGRVQALETQANGHRVRIDDLESEATDLRNQVERLRRSLRILRTRYLAALQHIREWRYWAITMHGDAPDLPNELVEDITDPPPADLGHD